MSWVLLILSAIISGFSLLQFNHSESLFLWKLSIISTEFGHWLALFTFAIAAILLCTKGFAKKKPTRVSIAFLIFATLVFLRPTIELAWNFHAWSTDVIQSFSIHDQSPKTLPNLAGLYFGAYREVPTNVQTIKFWESGKDSLNFDYYPPTTASGALNPKGSPWVLMVHGGGWDSGDRLQLSELNSYLASRGIAVIAMDYRLAPQFTWPAQKDDVWNLVNYVKDHATDLKIDATRWAILGRSAGGQIAERIAFGPSEKGNLSPLGCIAMYAPADLTFAYDLGREDDILKSRVLIRDYLAGTPNERPETYHDASPLYWISKDSTPSLIIHGPNDPLVWYVHSKNVYEKLRAHGVAADLITIPWATHGFDYNISGPGSLISTYAIELFLKKVLL